MARDKSKAKLQSLVTGAFTDFFVKHGIRVRTSDGVEPYFAEPSPSFGASSRVELELSSFRDRKKSSQNIPSSSQNRVLIRLVSKCTSPLKIQKYSLQ